MPIELCEETEDILHMFLVIKNSIEVLNEEDRKLFSSLKFE
jgi:hypothetical protein